MASEHGDLILEIPLHIDTTGLPQEMRAAVAASQEQLAAFAAQVKGPMRVPFVSQVVGPDVPRDLQKATKSTAEFTHAARALGSSLTFATGQTGFMAVEALRAAGNMQRLVGSAGGVGAAMMSLASGAKALWVSLGPVGQILAVTIALYEVLTNAMNKAKEASDAIAKSFADQADAIGLQEKAARELALAKGTISPREAAIAEAMQTPGMSQDRAERIADQQAEAKSIIENRAFRKKLIEEETAARAKGQADVENAAIKEMFATNARRAGLKDEIDILKGKDKYLTLIADKGERELTQTRDRLVEERALALEFGGKKPSDFLTGQLRMLALFRESAEERLKAAGEKGAGFGVSTTRPSGEFRFGPGAMGSVVGEQNEQKKTNALLQEAMNLNHADFQALQRELTGDAKSELFELGLR